MKKNTVKVNPELITPIYTINGVTVINVIAWMDACNINELNWAESCKFLRQYIKQFPSVTYYSAPHEEFFLFRAEEKAIREGKTFVIVEDLS